VRLLGLPQWAGLGPRDGSRTRLCAQRGEARKPTLATADRPRVSPHASRKRAGVAGPGVPPVPQCQCPALRLAVDHWQPERGAPLRKAGPRGEVGDQPATGKATAALPALYPRRLQLTEAGMGLAPPAAGRPGRFKGGRPAPTGLGPGGG
jgi:hypothetical protein